MSKQFQSGQIGIFSLPSSSERSDLTCRAQQEKTPAGLSPNTEMVTPIIERANYGEGYDYNTIEPKNNQGPDNQISQEKHEYDYKNKDDHAHELDYNGKHEDSHSLEHRPIRQCRKKTRQSFIASSSLIEDSSPEISFTATVHPFYEPSNV